jgi:DNA-binding CsgD family transcriptional regulator
MDKKLFHIGTRTSGRYPKGSGEDPQRSKDFAGIIDELKKKGLSEVERAQAVGLNTAQLRNKLTMVKEERKALEFGMALRLKEKGYSNLAIARRMGVNDKYVATLLNPVVKEKNNITKTTANILKDRLKQVEYVQVGAGVERQLNISRTKLKTAIAYLKETEGYTTHEIKVTQIGTGKKTTFLVLAKPGVETSELSRNRDKIKMMTDYSEDGGRSYFGLKPVNSVDSKRVLIRYNEEGGALKDGTIELRRGVDDINLGNSKYAQVRIGVDGTHYMKGMAIYNDDIPKGYDMVYNTNKKLGTDKYDVYKKMEDDPANPFGATVRQKEYIDKDGNKKLSSLNIVNEEGNWETWSRTISSQVLGKQGPTLAKEQLDIRYKVKREQLNEIMSLTNPAVKKKLLLAFSDKLDSEAVSLKGAAMPRQANKVLIPLPSLRENEVYAPGFRDGERVVLIRHPHGGIFEIPEVTVNNRNSEGEKYLKQAKDAIGIHPKIAEQLSGADFDGDHVLVIPNNEGRIKTRSPLAELKDFDPKTSYPERPGMHYLTDATKGRPMGEISNLITDMTIKGATFPEIARAVKHSMVVIDAPKHKLDYKRSFIENNIAELKTRYQGSSRSGASTLLSKTGATVWIPQRKDRVEIDPLTGKRTYFYTNDTIMDKQGRIRQKLQKTKRMAIEEDAYKLSSGTAIENVYAEHANRLKALANDVRKELINTPAIVRSPTAAVVYKNEVESLTAKLRLAEREQPLERQAHLIANTVIRATVQANPDLTKKRIKKLKGQAINDARDRVRDGVPRNKIPITPKEWEAIQAGAISNNALTKILNKADMDLVTKYALPKNHNELTPAKTSQIKMMLKRGYTQAEISDHLGISTKSISSLL